MQIKQYFGMMPGALHRLFPCCCFSRLSLCSPLPIIHSFMHLSEAHSLSWSQIYFRALNPQHQASYLHSLGATVLISNPRIISKTKCSKASLGKQLNLFTRFDPPCCGQHLITKTEGNKKAEQDCLQPSDLVLIWEHLHLIVPCMEII